MSEVFVENNCSDVTTSQDQPKENTYSNEYADLKKWAVNNAKEILKNDSFNKNILQYKYDDVDFIMDMFKLTFPDMI